MYYVLKINVEDPTTIKISYFLIEQSVSDFLLFARLFQLQSSISYQLYGIKKNAKYGQEFIYISVSFGILNYLYNFSTKFLSSVWYFCCIDFQIISLMLLLIVFYRSIKILIGHGKRAKFMIAYLVHENIFAIQK